MGAPIEEILGDNALMDPVRKEQVMFRIRNFGLTAQTRRHIYGRWARAVGIAVTHQDLEYVGPGNGTRRPVQAA